MNEFLTIKRRVTDSFSHQLGPAMSDKVFRSLTVGLAWLGFLGGQATGFTLQDATVLEINEAFDSGVLTSERLVGLYLNRIDAYDDRGPSLNSIITLNPSALETARALDQERQLKGPRSVLHGIPILLKDLLDTRDMVTTSGLVALRDSVPPDDAFIVQRLRDAGAIILGKTNLDEFGCCSVTRSSLGGQTRNPYDLTRVPGGSSGGTAAAIAANFAVIGTGSDTLGSIQHPASINSLVGLMPTRSLISGDGAVPPPMSHRGVHGPMARTVADAAAMLDIIAGYDPADPITAESQGKIPDSYLSSLRVDALDGARIGFPVHFLSANREVFELTTNAIEQMESLGAEVVEVGRFPVPIFNSWYNGMEYGINRYLETLGPDAPFSSLREILDSGQFLPALNEFTFRGDIAPEGDPAYQEVVAVREQFEEVVLNIMETENLDALVYPPLLSMPPTIASAPIGGLWETNDDLRNMNLSPFLGFPSITLPMGVRSNGFPIGIEFLGVPFSEPTLLGLAYAFEQATQHRFAPSATPPLDGETIPEPSGAVIMIVACVIAFPFLGTRLSH